MGPNESTAPAPQLSEHPANRTRVASVTSARGCAVRNGHTEVINVTYATGAISSPTDSKLVVDKFMTTAFRTAVAAGSEASFEYHFTANERLPTRDFVVNIIAFYETLGGARKFAAPFFNETVQVRPVAPSACAPLEFWPRSGEKQKCSSVFLSEQTCFQHVLRGRCL